MLRVGAVALPEEPESCILVLEVGEYNFQVMGLFSNRGEMGPFLAFQGVMKN